MIARTTAHVLLVAYIKDSEQNPRDRQDTEEINLTPRIEKNGGEDYGRHRSRSPDRRILRIVAPTHEVGKHGEQQPAEIEQSVAQVAAENGPCLLVSLKQLLKELPERQQHEHIDDQVHVIAVHETVRHGPVPFAPMHDTVGDEREPVEQLPIVERRYRNDRRYENQDIGHQSKNIFNSNSFSNSPPSACPVFMPLLFRSYSRNRPRIAKTLLFG